MNAKRSFPLFVIAVAIAGCAREANAPGVSQNDASVDGRHTVNLPEGGVSNGMGNAGKPR